MDVTDYTTTCNINCYETRIKHLDLFSTHWSWSKMLPFANDILKFSFLYEHFCVVITIPRKFVPKTSINLMLALVKIRSGSRTGDNPLPNLLSYSSVLHSFSTSQHIQNALSLCRMLPYFSSSWQMDLSCRWNWHVRAVYCHNRWIFQSPIVKRNLVAVLKISRCI